MCMINMAKTSSTKLPNNSKKRNNERNFVSSNNDKEDTEELDVSPVDFLFKTMAKRDPKKRKVKVNNKNEDLIMLSLLDDDSSDEEYVPKNDHHLDDASDDEDDEEDEELDADDDDDDESGEDSEVEDNNQVIPNLSPKYSSPDKSSVTDVFCKDFTDKKSSISGLNLDLSTKAPKLLVCSICLGDESHENDEIVECDSCGITVHEGCYGIHDESDEAENSDNSNASSSSTEPWFCDACLANVSSPSCDLCPNTGGIYKQTDVNRWVHLVCALYIPGVAFADTSRLSGITLFELPYERWGSRACIFCEDERLSRTGICISCDAGMCKSYFHVTCAQIHGLLSEATDIGDEAETIDPFFAHCKMHGSDKSAIKAKRRNWLALQSKIRMQRQAAIDQRISKKLDKARNKWLKNYESLKSPCVPTQKIPRPLTSSPSAVKKLIKKAELLGMSPQSHYMSGHDIVDVRKKWHIPPAFSLEFISYYFDRNSRMNTMYKRLEELKIQCRQLKSVENQTRQNYEKITSELSSMKMENNRIKSTAKDLLSLLGSFCRDPIDTPKFLEARESSKVKNNVKNQLGDESSSELLVFTKCGLCDQSKDFQKLVLCDSCKVHYHLYCLDPPLKRVPKKTKYGGWQCSDCTEKEEEEEEDPSETIKQEISRDSEEDGPSKRRKLREHVKGPNKFIPDEGFSMFPLIPLKKKNSSIKKRKYRKRSEPKIQRRKSKESFNDSFSSTSISVPLEPTIRKGGSSCGISLLAPDPVKRTVKSENANCCKCKSTSELKDLVQCDGCSLYYHFACCCPPLKKTPKKRGYQWFCEDCDEDEDEEEDEEEEDSSKALRFGTFMDKEDLGDTKENGDDVTFHQLKSTKENGELCIEDTTFNRQKNHQM